MTVPVRPRKFKIGTIEIDIPTFFPSVSSVKTALPPIDYIRLLNALGTINSQYLVSAFDLARANTADKEEFKQLLTHGNENGTIVLMDSGNYESYWKDSQLIWSQADFQRVLGEYSCPLAFGFDEQQPPSDPDRHLRLIIDRYKQDQAAAASRRIIPIIHGAPDVLPALSAEVARISGVEMLAVPERRLGNGVFERARTVAAIRQSLNACGRYVGLHLLGTGNPVSIAIYSITGADSFDGLEWCQTVVDHESALLFHLSQADFFTAQTSWGGENWPFQPRVLAHNLEFYTDWMARLRGAIHDGMGIEFCRLNFPRRIFVQCATALGWGAKA